MKLPALVVLSLVAVLLVLAGTATFGLAAGSMAPAAATAPAVSSGGSGPAAVPGVPATYVADAVASGRRFGVPWGVLLGIYRIECDFGQAQLPGCNPEGTENPYGAQGPGQFLPTTWRTSLEPMELIPPGPPTTSNAQGFATSGDGTGVANVWDPADAVASTARMLAADGGAADIQQAVFDYNHSWSYVQQVLAYAVGYLQSAQPPVPTARQQAVATVIGFVRAHLGDPYLWGGAGPYRWDCSGLMMVAFAQVGVVLPHNAELQYQATAATAVPLSVLQPGDLVFFGPSLAGISHVGVYVGDGQMIDAPHTGAVVRQESIYWTDLIAATSPLA